ncbi:MYH1s [Mytilus edulis]|uniref:MYH1s n=1 Tax=Mytilus edulis TaxID=6550 RepID=A0A8S3Q6N1_MYTED|nr:MYH1s [Mytilus edulis]
MGDETIMDTHTLTELPPSNLLVHQSFLSESTDFPSSQCIFINNLPYHSNTTSTQIDTDETCIINYMNDTLASLPRDTFVSNLVDKCRERNIDIETIRYELLNIAKRQQCFPYRNANLKKRLGPRKPSGEPIENTVIRLEREVNSLKGDHIQEIEYLNNTVSKLTKENKQLLDITSKNQERFKNFQNQITALRNTCENSNHQLSEFKIRFTQQNSQCDSHNAVISKLEKASSDLDKKLSTSAKDWDQLKHESGKLKNDTAILSKNYKGLQNDVKIESSRINQISDTRFLGVQSIKAKTDLLNDKVKEINDTLASTQEKSASFSQSITDIRKRLSKAEKEVNCLDKTSKSYANILTTKMDHMDNISTVDSSYCSSELALPDVHRTINITNNTEPEGIHSTCSVNQKSRHNKINVNVSNDSNDVIIEMPSNITKQSLKHNRSSSYAESKLLQDESDRSIPVHFPRSTCRPTQSSIFSGFVKNSIRKVKRFYIGGINKSSTETGMRTYLSQNGIRVTHLRYFDKQMRRTASAQVNIDAQDECKIRDPSFWPPGVFMKDWLPWSVFRSEKDITQDPHTKSWI